MAVRFSGPFLKVEVLSKQYKYDDKCKSKYADIVVIF